MGTEKATKAQLIKIPSDTQGPRIATECLLPSVNSNLVVALATSAGFILLLNTDPQKDPRLLVLTNEETEAQEAVDGCPCFPGS